MSAATAPNLGYMLQLTYPGAACDLDLGDLGPDFLTQWRTVKAGNLNTLSVTSLLVDFRDLRENLFAYVERYGAAVIGRLLTGLVEIVWRLDRETHYHSEAAQEISDGANTLLREQFPDTALTYAAS